MKMATNTKIFFLTLTCITFLVLSGLINKSYQKPKVEVSKQDSALNFNNNILALFSAGQKRLITDLFWITTLLESDESHYSKNDLNSWMYLRFKSIITLDPLFLNAYRFGGKYLSIIKDDLRGAEEVFDQGLRYYPEDYNLLYDASFLYGFEIKNYKKAIPLYEKLSTYPQSPEFVLSIIEKMKLNVTNDLELTFKAVEDLYKKTSKESSIYNKLEFDLYRIKAQIDLKCLNSPSKTIKCNNKDYYGNKYIFSSGKYKSKLKFKPYGLINN